MARIRRRLTQPKSDSYRPDTGLRVLGMLTHQGIERTIAKQCIGRHIIPLWSLDGGTRRIVDAQIDGTDIRVLLADGSEHTFDVEGYL